MTDDSRQDLIERLTAMADDELVLGHRNSEWTGHAPLLEEDIALANLAQDELGHAVQWYELRSSLDGSDPDDLAFGRAAEGFRSCRLVSLPRGDWAFTMLRQFLFDSYEAELLQGLSSSRWAPLAAAAAKISREELFHLRHSRLWLERLALGTEESRRRLLSACDVALPELPGLLAPLPGDERLSEAGYFPAADDLASAVRARLGLAFAAVGLDLTESLTPTSEPTGDRGGPDPDLGELLATMQSVARADPQATSW